MRERMHRILPSQHAPPPGTPGPLHTSCLLPLPWMALSLDAPKGVDDDVVDLVAPHQHVLPVERALPLVGLSQPEGGMRGGGGKIKHQSQGPGQVQGSGVRSGGKVMANPCIETTTSLQAKGQDSPTSLGLLT